MLYTVLMYTGQMNQYEPAGLRPAVLLYLSVVSLCLQAADALL